MKSLCSFYNILSEGEIKAIYKTALKILNEVGVIIDSDKILEVLAASGAKVDKTKSKAFFSENYTEKFMAESVPHEPVIAVDVKATGGVGGYALNYLNPENHKIERNTLESTKKLIILADKLSNVSNIGLLAIPSDIDPILTPLYGRFLLWRYAEKKNANCYLVWDPKVIPYIIEMCEIMAAYKKKPVKEVFRAGGFLISPLHLSKEEAEQFVFFWQKGLYYNIDTMNSLGGTSPVTIAGTLAVWLAEQIFVNIMNRVFYKKQVLEMGSCIAPLDMRKGIYPYGRPEGQLANIAASQIVRYLKAEGGGSAGGGNSAKGIDIESGLQTGAGAIMRMLTVGVPSMSIGKFSVDEVVSPELMVIHNEFIDHLNRLLAGFEVNEETLAFDVIKEVGAGGMFTDTEHTVEHFKKEIWMPELFSSEMLATWLIEQKTIIDKAKEVCDKIWKEYSPRGIDEKTENDLLKVIESAKKVLL